MSDLYTLERGDSAVLINVPHAGTKLPDDIQDRLTGPASTLPDTDWFVDELYGFAGELGAGLLVATHSRYVIDINRPADDEPLYAGHTTGLVPLETFSGQPIYLAGQAPNADECQERAERYWHPVHAVLEGELQRLKARHGHAVLLDAHSIRGEVPRLFDGRLPDLNLGSYRGASAEAYLVSSVVQWFDAHPQWSSVVDGRFQGGYITRHYGQPGTGIHALQLEMAQRVYMLEQPPMRDQALAAAVDPLLRGLVQALTDWTPGHAG